ncbi:MAG: serine/threonine-protein kinase [Gemmataceae bacterium]
MASEFVLRGRHGRPPVADEYLDRFPGLRNQLTCLLADRGGPESTVSPDRGRMTDAPAVAPAVPGYEIVGELGRGGMGVVYKARQPALNRTVAVKTLAVAPGAEAVARFRREAEAIAGLDHPHIVPVYEVGEWDAGGRPVPFFVMKWYPGGSLADAPCGPGSDPQAHARTVAAVARAVHHAHRRGVLHRDLKPANVLLDEAGAPHVADFGLAGRVGQHATAAGLGTPAYMAPEQAAHPAGVTVATDVYGLGAVLYHLLTGRPPFVADTPLATLDRVVSAAPARPAAANPAVPRDLETVCLKCLEKDPARRYASAAELADDLDRFAAGLPVQARPVSVVEQARGWVRRHPAPTAAASLVALTVMGAVSALGVSHARLVEKEAEATAALARERAARTDLAAALDREQQNAYLERVATAGRLYGANQLPEAWRRLDQCPPALRGWEWHYLDGRRRAAPEPIGRHPDWVVGAAFLADGRLLTADMAGGVRVWDAAARRLLHQWPADGPVTAVSAPPTDPTVVIADRQGAGVWDADAGRLVRRLPGGGWAGFAPDGRAVAVAVGPDVTLFDPATGAAGRSFRGHAGEITAAAFSADGEWLATAATDRTVRVWEVATGAAVGPVRKRGFPVRRLAFTTDRTNLCEDRPNGLVLTDPRTGSVIDELSPDTDRPALATGPGPRQVAVCGRNGEVTARHLTVRSQSRTFRGHTAPPTALAFSRDGRRVASAGGDGTVRVWPLDEPDAGHLADLDELAGGLAVAANGRRVAVAPQPQTKPSPARQVRVFDPAGREVCRFPGVGGVGFGPDGSWLAAGREDGGVSVRDPDTGAEKWAAAGGGRPASRVAVRPDGGRIAAGDLAGRVRVWDAAGKLVAEWAVSDGPVYALAFAADGRLAVGGRDFSGVWDVTARRPEWTVRTGTFAVAFDPDDRRLVTADRDRAVRVRDAATGAVERGFASNPIASAGAAFRPDGRRLVTADDRAVRVWDTATGLELLSLPDPPGHPAAVVWVGPTVYVAGDTVRAWRAEPERAGGVLPAARVEWSTARSTARGRTPPARQGFDRAWRCHRLIPCTAQGEVSCRTDAATSGGYGRSHLCNDSRGRRIYFGSVVTFSGGPWGKW